MESTLWKCQKGKAGRDLTTDHIFVILQEHFLALFRAEIVGCHANSMAATAHNLESMHDKAFTFSLFVRGDLFLPLEYCADVSK